MSFLTSIFTQLRRAAHTHRRSRSHRHRGAFAEPTFDVEAGSVRKRQLLSEGTHAMRYQPAKKSTRGLVEKEASSESDDEEKAKGCKDRKQKAKVKAKAEKHAQLDAVDKEKKKKAMRLAIKKVQESTSAEACLIALGDKVEEEWITTEQEIQGNIYRAWAFGEMRCNGNIGSLEFLSDNSQFLGAWLIWLAQIFGPLAMFISFAKGYGIDNPYHWERDWIGNLGFSDWTMENSMCKGMAVILLTLFQLNANFVLKDEIDDWRKVDFFFRKARMSEKDGACRFYLYLGALTNSYVVLATTLATFLVLGSAGNPKDVLFDALGLMFLYNMDDIGGEFAFADADSWPGHKMSWMTSEEEIVNEDFGNAPDEEKSWYYTETGENWFIVWCMRFTMATSAILTIVSPILFTLMPFRYLQEADEESHTAAELFSIMINDLARNNENATAILNATFSAMLNGQQTLAV